MQLTNDVVFDDRWRRPDLSPRDRRLVTIAGLSRAQIAEALTHLAFYAGWPKATKALTAVTKTLGK